MQIPPHLLAHSLTHPSSIFSEIQQFDPHHNERWRDEGSDPPCTVHTSYINNYRCETPCRQSPKLNHSWSFQKRNSQNFFPVTTETSKESNQMSPPHRENKKYKSPPQGRSSAMATRTLQTLSRYRKSRSIYFHPSIHPYVYFIHPRLSVSPAKIVLVSVREEEWKDSFKGYFTPS